MVLILVVLILVIEEETKICQGPTISKNWLSLKNYIL